jgi:hypothetical protein
MKRGIVRSIGADDIIDPLGSNPIRVSVLRHPESFPPEPQSVTTLADG